MSAQKKLKLQTPIGKAEWFSLNKVDKFGNYTCIIHLDESPETLKLISEIDSLAADGYNRPPYEKQADGSFKLKVKSKSGGTKKTGETYTVNPPVIYNALGKKVEGLELVSLNVGNGSEIRANIEAANYLMINQETQEVMVGVTCKVKSVQIAKIVEFNGGEADSGFDALELGESGEGESTSDFDF